MDLRNLSYYRLYFLTRNLMISKKDQGNTSSLLYWQQVIFVNLLGTLLTLGLVVVITSIRQFLIEDMTVPAVIVASFYLSFHFLAFARFIPYKIRELLFAWGFYSISIMIIVTTGPRGAGLVYLGTAYVLILLFSKRNHPGYFLLINITVFALLSLLYVSGSDSKYLLFREWKYYWWLIVLNAIIVHVFLSLMISMILKGMDRRYSKSQHINRNLVDLQKRSYKQIRLLNSLRQAGMVIMDFRLDYEERLNMALGTLQKELDCSGISLSMADKGSDTASCIAALPAGQREHHLIIPDFDEPFLLLDNDDLKMMKVRTPEMDMLEEDEIYFCAEFYTSGPTGFLELRMKGTLDESYLNYLQMNLFQLSAAMTNEQLIHEIKQSRDILEASYDEILQAWARILELRDIETQGHSRRVVGIALNIARKMNLSEEEQLQLRRGAFLHDIGKLGIPDRILKKEGPLDDDEWTLMRRHPEIGRDSVINIPFLRPAVPVIYHHHERWDGTGYPAGLAGEDIPLAARIFILADVYDALISNRPYRKAMERSEIIKY
ncbi:MAG: HD-GYP domain-containing protein, partial [Spirochaetales bacterium]|nr:HD-GYP domain-containing protein [Spirochaetales bacterium]